MSNNLLGPGGQPLQRDFIVIKIPPGKPLGQQALATISKITHCDVLQLPMDFEILSGAVAKQQLESIHRGIHAILNIKE